MVKIHHSLDSDILQSLNKLRNSNVDRRSTGNSKARLADAARRNEREKSNSAPASSKSATLRSRIREGDSAGRLKQRPKSGSSKHAGLVIPSSPREKTVEVETLCWMFNADKKSMLSALDTVFGVGLSSSDYRLAESEIRKLEQYFASHDSKVSMSNIAEVFGTTLSSIRRICSSLDIDILRNSREPEEITRYDWFVLLDFYFPLEDERRKVWSHRPQAVEISKLKLSAARTSDLWKDSRSLYSEEQLGREYRDLRARFRRASAYESIALKKTKSDLIRRIRYEISVTKNFDLMRGLRRLCKEVENLDYRPPRKATGNPVIYGGAFSMGKRS